MSRTVYSRKDYVAQLVELDEYEMNELRKEVKPEFMRLEPPDETEPQGETEPQDETPKPRLEQKEPDNYTSRLLKYIPAEVIALYLTLDALIRTSEQLPISVYWIVFVVCLVLTYFYLRRVEKVGKNIQLLISVIAYCVWVFAIGGPFVYLNWYQPIYGGLLLPTYTLAVAIIEA